MQQSKPLVRAYMEMVTAVEAKGGDLADYKFIRASAVSAANPR